MKENITNIKIKNAILEDNLDPQFDSHIQLADYLKIKDLKLLKMTGFKKEEGDMERISEYLKSTEDLKKLDFSDYGIEDEELKSLSDSLKLNSTLNWLDLSGNKIKRDNLGEILSSIKKNNFITKLTLSGCSIRGIEFDFICQFLENNVNLVYLDLSENQVQKYLKKISRSLLKNNTLKELHLCDCELTKKEMKYFSNFLKLTTSLTLLDFSCNEIKDKGNY